MVKAHDPITPGEILLTEFLEPLGITPTGSHSHPDYLSPGSVRPCAANAPSPPTPPCGSPKRSESTAASGSDPDRLRPRGRTRPPRRGAGEGHSAGRELRVGRLPTATRSACIRILITGSKPKAKRIEFRVPDPTSNPYLAFSAMLMAGLDGIKNKIEPREPVDKDLYELPPDEAADIQQVPGSLPAVIDALEPDHAYLTQGNVFTDDPTETWVGCKRANAVDSIRLRPHPHQFELYLDI